MPCKSRSRKHAGADVAPPPSLPSQVAAPLMSIDADSAFDFLAKVPSPVMLPPFQELQHSRTVTRSRAAAPPVSAASAAPPLPTQSATLPTPTAGGDSSFAFLEMVPSPVTLRPTQEGQVSDSVRLIRFVSV